MNARDRRETWQPRDVVLEPTQRKTARKPEGSKLNSDHNLAPAARPASPSRAAGSKR